MDLYAVIGNPVEHSRSPDIHTRFAAQTGETLRFERLLAARDGFAATVAAFAARGGRGLSVTVPFKREAFALAERRSTRAALAESANLLRREASGWWADNTDGAGLVRDIARNAGVALAEARVLLIGAGGAAAGSLGPLIEARPREVVVANRSAEKAAHLVGTHAALAATHRVALRDAPLERCGTAFDVVINATASSLHASAPPVSPDVLAPGCLALDMMYGPAARSFLDWARGHGALARDGMGMLVEQAAVAFFAWRGVHPDAGAVLSALAAETA